MTEEEKMPAPYAHTGLPGWHFEEEDRDFFRIDCMFCGLRNQWKAKAIVDGIARDVYALEAAEFGKCRGCGYVPILVEFLGFKEWKASREPNPSPLNDLFITPEEAAKKTCQTLGEIPVSVTQELPLTESVHRIEKALEALARHGLNLRAVVALIHDSNPSIPKKSIKRVLESLRELPALYGKEGK